MHPAKFDYHRAGSLAEAIDLLGRHPQARILAGGHSLIPMMKLRLAHPAALIDIARLPELKGIARHGDVVRLGALTTHAELAASATLAVACPLLREAAARIGDPAVRNKGTLGGNLAHADPASDLPGVLVASDATVVLAGRHGERRVAAADFFVGLLDTDLRPGEVLAAVELRAFGPRTGSCYVKHEHPASGYAVCGAAAVVQLAADGTCSAASLCYNGVTAVPHRASAVTAALVGRRPDEEALAQAMTRLAIAEPLADLHASGPYRVELARVHGRRALATARDRAR